MKGGSKLRYTPIIVFSTKSGNILRIFIFRKTHNPTCVYTLEILKLVLIKIMTNLLKKNYPSASALRCFRRGFLFQAFRLLNFYEMIQSVDSANGNMNEMYSIPLR